MRPTLSILSTTFFVVLSGVSGQQTLTINTPANAAVCEPLDITWDGGTGPYFLSLHSGADPDGNELQDFGEIQGDSYVWPKVTYAAGTSLDLTVRDSDGNVGQTAAFTVQAGADVSCLNGGASAAPSASASATGASSAAGSSAAAATSRSSPAATSGSQATSTASSSPKASSSNSAMANGGVSYGAAGVLGAVIAAVLA